MNWVIAIIQPHRLDAVREALSAVNIHGMTITEVKGFGRQRGHTEIYRGAEYQIAYIPKLKVEVACSAVDLERVVEAIREAAHTGKIGDGKIFVLDLKEAMRIRTGEVGGEAL
jgi:nitrogen regulatory protein P-II 2